MDQVSRPMQIALVAVVLFAAVYFVALKPKTAANGSSAPAATSQPATGSTSGSAPGVTGLTNAIKKAHGAVDTSQANAQTLSTQSAQSSGTATTPAATTPATTSTTSTNVPTASGSTGTTNVHAKRSVKHAKVVKSHPIPRAGPGRAAAAIADHRVLAVLFYNPRAADDLAVHKAFKGLRTHKGKVILVSAPISRLASYKAVTAKVSVTGSPTFIVFDRAGHPRTFVGFVDPAELANHIADALHGFKTK